MCFWKLRMSVWAYGSVVDRAAPPCGTEAQKGQNSIECLPCLAFYSYSIRGMTKEDTTCT